AEARSASDRPPRFPKAAMVARLKQPSPGAGERNRCNQPPAHGGLECELAAATEPHEPDDGRDESLETLRQRASEEVGHARRASKQHASGSWSIGRVGALLTLDDGRYFR